MGNLLGTGAFFVESSDYNIKRDSGSTNPNHAIITYFEWQRIDFRNSKHRNIL
jgi:hypothetical protein